jgi:hypothetical protein
VRREDQVRRDRRRRWRLVRDDVEPGAAEPPVAERLEDGIEIHDLAARGVHEERARPHRGDLARADQVTRFRRERHVDGHRVASLEELVELHEAHTRMRHGQDVRRPHLGAEREEPRRDRRADAPEPDDADAHPGDRAERPRTRRIPAAALHHAIELDDAADEAVQQRERVIGDLFRAVVGHVHDDDATPLRRLDVHVVEADRRGADRAQRGEPGHELLSDLRRRHRQHRHHVVLRRSHHLETRELVLRI